MRGMKRKLGLLVVLMLALCGQAFAQTVVPSTKEEENKQIAIIKSDAGLKEKADACRFLSIIGTTDAVQPLAAMLGDEKLGHMARYALETIPGNEADKALLNAMGELKGLSLVGVIGSYGVRGKTEGAETVIKFLNDSDPQVAQAAARALGKVGHQAFVEPLRKALADAPEGNLVALYEGLFRIAEKQAAQDNAKDAIGVYEFLQTQDKAPHQVRGGALRGLLLSRGEKGLPLLEKSLKSEDYILFSAAVQTTREMEGKAVTDALVSALKGLPAGNQSLIALTLGNRGDKAATPALLKLAAEGPVDVRVAAICALPQIGDGSAIPTLVNLMDDSETLITDAARKAFVAMPGRKANQAVMALLKSKDSGKVILAIDLTSQRRMKQAIPTLLAAAKADDANVRKAALTTVGELGGTKQIDPLLNLLTQPGGEADMETATRALIAVCSRLEKPESSTAQVVAKMADATPAQKNSLMRLLGTIGGTDALTAVKNATQDSDADTQIAAVRTLANWKSTDAAPILAELAKTSLEQTHKVTALRGYIKMIRADGLTTAQRLEMAQKASELAERTEEKKMLAGMLGDVPDVKALAMVMKFYDNPQTSDEAAIAALTICEKIGKGNKEAATAALQKIKEGSKNADLTKRADAILDKIK